jgi:predicted small lipoprotein YifL
MSRAVTLIVTLSILTLGLAACGKRGALEPPSAAGPIREEKSASVEPKPDEKPHRPFILDGLLR